MSSVWLLPTRRASPRLKSVATASAFLDFIDQRIDAGSLGSRVRAELGSDWSWLSCIQHLASKEALAELSDLPVGWRGNGWGRAELVLASFMAAHVVLHSSSEGKAICARRLAQSLANSDLAQALRVSRGIDE